MTKKIIGSFVLASMLVVAVPAFADMATTTSSMTIASKIACVGAAVSVRETALDGGITAYTNSITSAYTVRAAALQSAYATTTPVSQIKSMVKSAWSAFKASIKSASSAWKTTQKNAWATFKTSIKACKAPASVATDTGNVGGEVGQ